MSATFEQFLAEKDDPSLYVRVPKRAIFDEHTDTYWIDPKTRKMVAPNTPGAKKVVQKFDRGRLEKIAQHNNKRASHGDLAPITFGHTDPEEPDESKQPEGHGYDLNYLVEFDPKRNKHMLYADHYIRKSDYPEATTYPFTSIELWPEDLTIHPVSFLRRTPQRDLGQWIYGRDPRSKWNYLPVTGGDGRTTGHTLLRFSRAGQLVLRYGMETNMDMPAADADLDKGLEAVGEGEPSHGARLERFMRHVMGHPDAQHFAKHYAMEDEQPPPGEEPPLAPPDATAPMQNSAMTAPNCTNTDLPDEPMKHDRGGMAAQYAKLEKDYLATKREVLQIKQDTAKAKAEVWAEKLQTRGVILGDTEADIADEVQQFARIYLAQGDAGCQQYARKLEAKQEAILRQSMTSPVGRIDVPMGAASSTGEIDIDGDPTSVPEREMNQILQFQQRNSLWDYPLSAVAARMGGTTAQRYGKQHANGQAPMPNGRR
jgi:hypothetical protein